MKEWTKEEIERLVPEGFIRLTPNGMVRDSSLAVARALLQTRQDLESARKDREALLAMLRQVTYGSYEEQDIESIISRIEQSKKEQEHG